MDRYSSLYKPRADQNFPNLIGISAISEAGDVEPGYVDELHSFMRKLPATFDEISRRFGGDFFGLSRLDRLIVMVRELRSISDSGSPGHVI